MNDKNRHRQVRKQLGTKADVIIICKENVDVEQIFQSLWNKMDAFEARFSRFNPQSELSYVNARAGLRTSISREFADMISCCVKYNTMTGEIFNPLLLPALQRAGYKGSWPEVTNYDSKIDYSERKVARFHDVYLDDSTIHLPKDTALDLGGIGKGYALDLASSLLENHAIEQYCISFGGDIICSGHDVRNSPWQIGVSYVHEHEKPVAFFTNLDGNKLAIASSTVVRRKGDDWNHLIDPKTNKPTTSPVLMTSVVTKSGISADICAKYFLLEPNGKLANPTGSDVPLALLYQFEKDMKPIQSTEYISLI